MYHTFLVCIEKANNSEYFFNIEKNIKMFGTFTSFMYFCN